MKNLSKQFCVLALPALVAASYAFAAPRTNSELAAPVLLASPVEHVFVPQGFDDNDNVEVVMFGHFTSSCSKVGPVSFQVNHEAKIVTLKAQSWTYNDRLCQSQEMHIPFSQTVQLGTLPARDYKIMVEGPALSKNTFLKVDKATVATPDDFLYAPVDEVSVRPVAARSPITVTIGGQFPARDKGCLAIDEVRVNKAPGVIVILPIVERREQAACQSAQREFTETVEVGDLAAGEYLVHVRVMNGQSVNKVVRINP